VGGLAGYAISKTRMEARPIAPRDTTAPPIPRPPPAPLATHAPPATGNSRRSGARPSPYSGIGLIACILRWMC
jgi:hypothetical protein